MKRCTLSGLGLLLGVCLVLLLVLPSPGLAEEEQMWEGRTTLLFVPRTSQGIDADCQLANLVRLCTSNAVISRSISSLQDLGVEVDLQQLIGSLSIERIPGTTMVVVRVTANDPSEAKSAADVIAAEMRRFQAEVASGPSRDEATLLRREVKAAKSKLADAAKARANSKRGALVPVLDAELKAAQQSYLWLQSKLDAARLKLLKDVSIPDLLTVDAAYAYPKTRSADEASDTAK